MGFQTAVYLKSGVGIQGEIGDSGPVRALPYLINSPDAANNVFGHVFTGVNDSGVEVARAGNADSAGTFLGFLCNPKGSASFGTVSGGPLAPTLTLPNNTTAEILSMGSIWADLSAAPAVNVGDIVIYAVADGSLSTIAENVVLPSGYAFAHAKVTRFNASSGLGFITITDVPTTPPAS